MRLLGRVFLVGALVLVMASPAWAARTRMHELAESSVYKEKTGGMIGRGLLNVVTSFVDVLVNVVNDTKSGPPLIGTLTGFAKGAGCGLLRIGSGAVDVVTFWVPGFNGFPVSDSYDNCLSGVGSGGMSRIPRTAPQTTQAMFNPGDTTNPGLPDLQQAQPVEIIEEPTVEANQRYYKK